MERATDHETKSKELEKEKKEKIGSKRGSSHTLVMMLFRTEKEERTERQ